MIRVDTKLQSQPQVNQNKELTAQDAVQHADQLVAEYLKQNPQLASALAIFDVAQEEYRKSLLAMTSVRVVTGGTTNVEA